MGLKKIGLVKVVKILVISSVVSLVLLGLLILIFDIPSNFTGGRGVGNLDPKNTISVDVEKTYKIDDINDIEVDLSFSDIDVTVTDGDTISFIYTGSINSRPVLKEPYLKFTETRGKLNIETIWKGNYRIFNSSLVLKISIPENGLDNLNLSTSSGGIIVIGDVSDELRINTSSGKAAVNGFSGSLLRSNSSSGDHDFINIQTGEFRLDSSSGDMTIDNSSSRNISIGTSSGDIEITGFSTMESKIRTTSGESVLNNYSGNLDFSSSSGYLKVEFNEDGDDIIARTSSGDVSLLFKEDAGFNLKTDTSSGNFKSDFQLTLTGSFDGDSIDGSVGDGKGMVRVETSSGDISINRK